VARRGITGSPPIEKGKHLRNKAEPGFTLIDLVAVIAVVGMLLLTLLPALARSSLGTKALQCLNNNRQLVAAWRMYADDSGDLIAYASDDGSGSHNSLNQYAWTSSHLDFNPNNRMNWDTNYDIAHGPLWRYCGGNPTLDRCPADESSVTVNGVTWPRVRSTSANLYLGGFVGTDGGWSWADPYRIYTKITDLSAATGPVSQIFVFLDERADRIAWGNFMAHMYGYDPASPANWFFTTDLPAMYHDGATSLSFADGHGEFKRWLDPRTNGAWNTDPNQTDVYSPNNPDVYWLQDHSTRRK
jgi:type II secretory pathway pseudopilin PulG